MTSPLSSYDIPHAGPEYRLTVLWGFGVDRGEEVDYFENMDALVAKMTAAVFEGASRVIVTQI